jgi:hypothetical protein
MLSINVSALRIIGVGEIEEIPGCDGDTCWRVFILPLRNLSRVLVNAHSSPASPIEFQYAKQSEPRMSTLGGIRID